MYKPAIAALATTALAVAASIAEAGPGRHGPPLRVSAAQSAVDYAPVVDVEPLVQRIRVTEPRERCYQDTRYEPAPDYGNSYGPHQGSAGSMILGGLVGAALGTQIGSGDGRRAATVAGAVIGSAVGHDVAARRIATGYAQPVREVARTVERCEVEYVESWEERVEGYRVTYLYQGRQYTTELPYDPGERIRVRVDVRPDESYGRR